MMKKTKKLENNLLCLEISRICLHL